MESILKKFHLIIPQQKMINRNYKKLIKFNEPNTNGDIFTKDTDFGNLTTEVFQLNETKLKLEKRHDGIYVREVLNNE